MPSLLSTSFLLLVMAVATAFCLYKLHEVRKTVAALEGEIERAFSLEAPDEPPAPAADLELFGEEYDEAVSAILNSMTSARPAVDSGPAADDELPAQSPIVEEWTAQSPIVEEERDEAPNEEWTAQVPVREDLEEEREEEESPDPAEDSAQESPPEDSPGGDSLSKGGLDLEVTGPAGIDELRAATCAELREACKANGLSSSGTKATLIQRLTLV